MLQDTHAPAHQVVDLMAKVELVVTREARQLLKQHGITHQEARLLFQICDNPGRSQAWHTEALGYWRLGGVSALMTRLERKGLIERRGSPTCGRCVNVTLSVGGEALVHQVRPRYEELQERQFGCLSEPDREALTRALHVLGQVLQVA